MVLTYLPLLLFIAFHITLSLAATPQVVPIQHPSDSMALSKVGLHARFKFAETHSLYFRLAHQSRSPHSDF